MMINWLHRYFVCPIWERPLLAITATGIEIKCKWCKEKHSLSRAQLEKAWADIEQAANADTLHTATVS